ncbi:hypothetical protein, conserved [Plasmodium gonderi]|uniref:Uncharacterized protein n=1 Tax=Plasmodium gonderi TaxID=77519 RepID=A0A1Y1JQL0_PLAGO|nr:hypothetical protein, conserved [Plasmodium gonderi]GAW83808.1 hypothetical protein, conserved [Plasmodium gonderi]
MRKCKFLFFILPYSLFSLFWNTENVRAQPQKRGHVNDLIKQFETNGNLDTSQHSSNKNEPLARYFERKEHPLSGRQRAIYEDDAAVTSYSSENRKAFPTDKRSSDMYDYAGGRGGDSDVSSGEGYIYSNDYRNDYQHSDGSNQMRQKHTQLEGEMQNRYSNRNSYPDEISTSRIDEDERMKKKDNIYLGEDFETFNKNLGLTMDDYMIDSDYSDNGDVVQSKESKDNFDDGFSHYGDLQFIKRRKNQGINNSDLLSRSRVDGRRHAIYHDSDSNIALSSENEIQGRQYNNPYNYKHDYTYGINNQNSEPYYYTIPDSRNYNDRSSHSINNGRSINSSEVSLEPGYSTPFDSNKSIYGSGENIYEYIPLNEYQEKRNPREKEPKYISLDDMEHVDRNTSLPIRRDKKTFSSSQQQRSSSNAESSDRFKNGKKIDITKGVPNRYDNVSKQIYEQNKSKSVRRNSGSLSAVTVFNTYQERIFLNKLLKNSSGSNKLKNMFSRSGAGGIVSITGEIKKAAEKCIAQNKHKLTRPVLMQNLAFKDSNLLMYYENNASYITSNCATGNGSGSSSSSIANSTGSGTDTCLKIRPMVYEDDEKMLNALKMLPSLYILNMYEFILTNSRMCGSFKTLIKNNIKENNLTTTDIVLSLSNFYFQNVVNPILVNHLMNFLKTKNEIHLNKYYLGAMLSFVPFIKPAMKIYFGDNYSRTNLYVLDNELKKIFTELLIVSLRWTQAFQDKFSDVSNEILMKVNKNLTSFSTRRVGNMNEKFKTLDSILLNQKINNDLIANKDDKYRQIMKYIWKYINNIYFMM